MRGEKPMQMLNRWHRVMNDGCNEKDSKRSVAAACQWGLRLPTSVA